MNKFLILLLAMIAFSWAADDVKHPWFVQISGNKAFSNYQLEEQLDVPEEFGQMDTTKQDFLMRLSIENIKALYYSRGYYSLDMALNIRKDTTSEGIVQRGYFIHIRDGERYKFSGAKIIVPEEAKLKIDESKLNISKENYYNQEDISEDLQEIQRVYRKEGYLHAYLSSIEMLDSLHKKIFVEITITPGAKVLMGNMISTSFRSADKKLQGPTEAGLTDTAWLSSLWKIEQGELIDGNQYNSFKSKLFSTQLFTQVKMSDTLREDGLSDVYLNVTERVPGETRYGFFYEEIYGFGALAYARHKNFFGHFHEFSSSVQIAQHKQEASIGYANPLLFGTSVSFIPTAIRFDNRLTLNHEKITQPAYDDRYEERYEIINRGDITFGITNHIRFRGTIDTRYVSKAKDTVLVVSKENSGAADISDTASLSSSQDSLLETQNKDKLLKLKGEIALTFDFTNDYFNPTKGIRLAPTFGAGTNWDGDLKSFNMRGNPYTYGEITANAYLPLFWTFFGAISGSTGSFFAKALEEDARIFYQGGSRSVRGYKFRHIFASRDSIIYTGQESSIKADTIINTGLTPTYFRFNEEIRWMFPWKGWRHWQLVQFYDWAKVTDDEDDIYTSARNESLGLGIRYSWQFLTFRLDYAFKKNLTDWSAEGFAWSRFAFDLSHTF